MEHMQKTILGPPGCGKTQTNIRMVQGFIASGIPPEKIACVSFTRKAAEEAKSRICEEMGLERDIFPFFQTLHSMAFRSGMHKGDEVMARKDMKAVCDAAGIQYSGRNRHGESESDLDLLGNSTGDNYLRIYHLSRNQMVDLEQTYRQESDYRIRWEELTRLVAAYENYKHTYGKIDFTDMIEGFIARNVPLPIDALFVDEAQDLSTLQWEMIDVLRRTPRIQVFTGDDDQAIMGFQGADVGRFLAATETKEVLSTSYRLPREPWIEAQRIVSRIEGRAPKEWFPTDETGKVRFHQDFEHLPLEEGEWCVMARTNQLLKKYAGLLEEEGWIYSMNGVPSIAPNKFQAILDWEELCKGRKIPLSALRNVYSFMKVGQGFSRGYAAGSEKMAAADQEALVTYQEATDNFGLLAKGDIRWYKALEKLDLDTQNYILNALKRGDNVKNPRIKLSTIHKMKGGECDKIAVIPDISPAAYHQYRIDPNTEHRVFYVAVTRAKQELHILEPETKQFYAL